MARSRSFKQVDVFTHRPFLGNPVAVILEADGLGSQEMLRIAAWTNLSETTFVLPPTQEGADYRLRIFTATGEVPFAGHPTLGSAHAVLESGLAKPVGGTLTQECGAGLLPLRVADVDGRRTIFVESPRTSFTPLDASWDARIASALGAAPAGQSQSLVISVGGAIWLVVQLEGETTVHHLHPHQDAVLRLSGELKMHGITVFALADGTPGDADHHVYVRSFAPAVNVAEDPVCGSGNAAVAAFLKRQGLLTLTGGNYVAHQGHELGRRGIVHVRTSDGDAIWTGGCCVTCLEGNLLTEA